jgi:lysylphosphatidylglycerol synthetase-like protein (DUF2156 family)
MATPTNNAHATRRRTRVTAVGAAVLTPAAIWLVGVPLLGVDLQVAQPSGRPPAEITLPLVLVTALAASLAGWGLLALLERLTRRARTIWTATAVVALVVSFAPAARPRDAHRSKDRPGAAAPGRGRDPHPRPGPQRSS